MKVPFRLRRLPEPRPAQALLAPGHDSAVLLRMCVRLRLDPLPAIFAVTDGFLLRLEGPLTEPIAGVIRFAELGANVFLPADAELTPGLLADEAAALGQKRGLVFLPEGRVLEFQPDHPVPPAQLLQFDSVRRRSWEPLPEPPALAERIHEITREQNDLPPDDILQAGGEGIGGEAPRPDDASLGNKLIANPLHAMGRALARLGAALDSKRKGAEPKSGDGAGGKAPRSGDSSSLKDSLGKPIQTLGRGFTWLVSVLIAMPLTKLGGKLMKASMKLVPRLSEKILGQQQAALRELLRQFRAGKIEEALRRALPLGLPPPRGSVPFGGTHLPHHGAGYSLADVFGRDAGPYDLWLTPDELQRELEREYRKQAEAATRRGDYRRAAFIYGRLLGDYRLAAASLAQGGLHRDAALIYLKKLEDHLAAAREFEAAGEVDRALELYRQRAEHVRAGDLLRRIGEEELALAEYREAASLIAQRQGHFQAGELLLTIARRPDLARNYFELGWSQRPHGSAVPCARRLLHLHADSGDSAALMTVVTEAEDLFAAPGNDNLAGELFNEVARLSERPQLAKIGEELRDRALLTLAHKVRQRSGESSAGAAQLVPSLFGAGTVWEAPLVSDAQFAVKIPQPRLIAASAATMTIRAVIPVVRAVCQAPGTGELFLGFESGEVACCDLERGNYYHVDIHLGPIHGLAVTADGNALVVHSGGESADEEHLASYIRDGGYRLVEKRSLGSISAHWLCPTLGGNRDCIAVMWNVNRSSFVILRGPRLLVEHDVSVDCRPTSAWMPSYLEWGIPSLMAFDGRELTYFDNLPEGKAKNTILCPFPARTRGSSLTYAPIGAMHKGEGRFELTGIGAEGVLNWLEVAIQKNEWLAVVSRASCPGPYSAATMVRHGLIAAVAADHIAWLRALESGLREHARQAVSVPHPIASFPIHSTHELAIVSRDGSIVRVRESC